MNLLEYFRSVIAVEQWVPAMVRAMMVMWLHSRVTARPTLHRLLHVLQFQLLVVGDPDTLVLLIVGIVVVVVIDAIHLGSAAHRRQLDCAVVASVGVVRKALVLNHEISRRLIIVPAVAGKPMRMLVVVVVDRVLLLQEVLVVIVNHVVSAAKARLFLGEDFAVEWTITSLHLLLGQ